MEGIGVKVPHKPAVCVYCQKPMGLDRIHPTMTAYHGDCRLAVIRVEWKDANEGRRVVLMAEAEAIKKHQTTESP